MIRRIVADSSCDLQRFPGADFISVPMKIITAQQEYVDNAQLDVAKMAESLRQYKGHSSTACPNASDWESAFAGADEVFALTITSALSGSCNATQCAKAHYESIHPDCRIHVIDTLSTGPEMLLLIEQLYSMLQAQMCFDDICREIAVYSQKTHLLFLLSSVKNLSAMGGSAGWERRPLVCLAFGSVDRPADRGLWNCWENAGDRPPVFGAFSVEWKHWAGPAARCGSLTVWLRTSPWSWKEC